MSKLYNFIETSIVNAISGFAFVDDQDDVYFLGLNIKTPKWWLNTLIRVISLILYLIAVLFIGQYLWNQGLVAVMPNIVAPIGDAPSRQLVNPFAQLVVTLFALTMIS